MWTINRKILLFALCPLLSAHSQPVGTWQAYASYRSAGAVDVVGGQVYAATRYGLFYYNKATGETAPLSKVNGLSDVGVSRLFYDTPSKKLLIYYRSGMIDLLSVNEQGEPTGEIQPVDAIRNATQLPAGRQANQAYIPGAGRNVYVSTNFGIVVFDPAQAGIRDTYRNIAPGGADVAVQATALSQDTLYALTNRGLLAAPFSDKVNLAYFGNWRPLATPEGQAITALGSVGGRLRAAVDGIGVYERQQGRWVSILATATTPVRFFPTPRAAATPADINQLVSIGTRLTNAAGVVFQGNLLAKPQDAVADGAGVWVADAQNGLLQGQNSTFQAIVPEGPPSDQFPRLFAYSQQLVALGGDNPDTPAGLDADRQSGKLAVAEGRWQAYPATRFPFNAAAYVVAGQQLFLGSYGGGLWSQTEGGNPVAIPLPSTISPYITALATDYDGNLWIATAPTGTQPTSLHVRRANGQFESFRTVSQQNIVQIVPDDNGNIWLRLSYSSILVVNPQTSQTRYLYATANEGGLPDNVVRTLVKDKNGLIWAGTDLGVAVFDDPYTVFTGAVNANIPILNRRRLLANESVTAMAVDGSNRKWIATKSGLYRVAADGTELFETFTTANSPLPSGQILDMAVEPVSGNVFVATAAGLVSYRGTATEPAGALSKVTVFPNPVRPDFSGVVAINGLIDQATVKILDAAGQLVYETKAQGGTATWNLLDYRGRSARTGIYLVVVISANGGEGVAGKLAVVR
ncbi:type IX secretion system anionic LPS delivery protein PorZ [Arsenicibacter rosenii]|uniref:PorZ N-terminal beta-propeller domain-containing protein n=1 Tax=Arsenicibacter rosenii TaxID=1750698 RepID=A0A1S2VN90_9BACT|nr:two-component regulator propeller domain-containing protein [Arsenicibacter rosenii]OIN59675.1 hypothetical protein BLX24_07340 [Arsenicibacter rosenii]